MPLLNSQYMNVWKNSSLAIIVGFSDIFLVILIMMNNGQASPFHAPAYHLPGW